MYLPHLFCNILLQLLIKDIKFNIKGFEFYRNQILFTYCGHCFTLNDCSLQFTLKQCKPNLKKVHQDIY